MNLILRVRHEMSTKPPLSTVWLIQIDHNTRHCLMYGVVSRDRANALAEQLKAPGIVLDVLECPDRRRGEPKPETVAATQQKVLFVEGA